MELKLKLKKSEDLLEKLILKHQQKLQECIDLQDQKQKLEGSLTVSDRFI